MIIAATLAFDTIRIRFDGTLHCAISRSKLCGVNAWTEGPNKYLIEYTFIGGQPMLCEYDTESHWHMVLTELDAVL